MHYANAEFMQHSFIRENAAGKCLGALQYQSAVAMQRFSRFGAIYLLQGGHDSGLGWSANDLRAQ